jgi:3',5'-cyclic AMP phosphodiesterase CpdA
MMRNGLWPALLLIACGAAAEPVTVVVISDLNGSYGQIGLHPRVRQAVARIIEDPPDLVISTGDMIAGQQPHPKLSAQQLHDMWTEFHRTVTEPLAAAGIPFAITPGNHDASAYPSFKHERAAYRRAWSDHRPDLEFLDGGDFPFRYAFRLNGVLFVSLDATRTGPLPAEESAWLSALLAAAPASEASVLFGHLPVWPVAQGRETEFLDDAELRGLLADEQVTLVLSGHHHAYYPGLAGGTAHVAQACLGSGPRRLLGAPRVSPRGYTRLTIDDGGIVELAAYVEPGFEEPLDPALLPAHIDTSLGRLTRFEPAPR